jgi:hypothetical protein
MSYDRTLRIVVASANDVKAERRLALKVVEYLNSGIAKDRSIRLVASLWETDAYPSFHLNGPQGAIDEALRIENCDLFIGVFGKRFGTPVYDADSGTEHEFFVAYNSWKKSGRPHIMIYFKEGAATFTSKADTDQLGQVLQFREKFPREGFWWTYTTKSDFETLLRKHLTQYVRDHFPLKCHSLSSPSEEAKASEPISSSGEHKPVEIFHRQVRSDEFAEPQVSLDSVNTVKKSTPRSLSRSNGVTVLIVLSLTSVLALFLWQRSMTFDSKIGQRDGAPSVNIDPDVPNIILLPYTASRGEESVARQIPVFQTKRRFVCLHLKLPPSERSDLYNLIVIEESQETVVFTTKGLKRFEDRVSIVVDLKVLGEGIYRIALNKEDEAPIYYLFSLNGNL